VKSGLYTEEKARANWDWFKEVMAQVHERVETLAEVPEHVDIFLKDEIEVDEKAAKKFLTDAVKPFFQRVSEGLRTVEWTIPAIEKLVRSTQEEMGLKPKESFQPIRVAITGRTASPGLFETIYLIGRERVLERMAPYC